MCSQNALYSILHSPLSFLLILLPSLFAFSLPSLPFSLSFPLTAGSTSRLLASTYGLRLTFDPVICVAVRGTSQTPHLSNLHASNETTSSPGISMCFELTKQAAFTQRHVHLSTRLCSKMKQRLRIAGLSFIEIGDEKWAVDRLEQDAAPQ